MHESIRVFCAKQALVLMTLKTFPFRHMAISLKNVDMALLTSDPSGNVFAMIELPTLHLNISFGLNVTGIATSYGTRNAFLLSPWPSLVKMADKAIGFMDGKVGPLDQLGMAGGASKFHPPSQLSKMFSMGESHIFIDHILF